MPETGSLAAALVQLQAALPRITKDETAEVTPREGRKYSYAYTSLTSIHEAILPLLAALGLCWVCKPTVRDDGQFVLRYMIKHAPSGEYEDGDYPLPSSGTPQQVGSAITYAKRYTICAVLGIAPAEDDDDGQAAEQAAKPSYEDRVAAGRMDRTQVREHNKLVRDTLETGPADHQRAPLPDDEWNTRAPEASPGSSLPAQRQAIGRLAARLGASSDRDRHVLIGKALGTGELTRSTQLSAQQASDVIKYLQDQIGADR